ncbi:MAG: VTT domain-containing protein [Pseudomonadota bacterium]
MAAVATIGRIFKGMDRRTQISAAVSLAAVLSILVLILFGQDVLGLDQQSIVSFFDSVAGSPWAPFAVVAVFVTLALIGFPQVLLYAGTVAVFGAALGMAYAWAATIISATVTYFLGRRLGAQWVKKISDGRAQTMIRVMQNRGFLAAMIVRWTPSAPFIVVNSVCGAAAMPLWKFIAGTGIGTLPKLALIAFFTEQLDELGRFLTRGDTSSILTLLALAAAWIGFIFFCRWLYKRLRSTSLAGLAPRTEIAEQKASLGDEDETRLNLKSKAG